MNKLNTGRRKGKNAFFEMILYLRTLPNVNPPLWLEGNKLILSLEDMALLK